MYNEVSISFVFFRMLYYREDSYGFGLGLEFGKYLLSLLFGLFRMLLVGRFFFFFRKIIVELGFSVK